MKKSYLLTAVFMSCIVLSCGSPDTIKVTHPEAVPAPVPAIVPTQQEEPKLTIKWEDYDDGNVFEKAEENSDLLFLVFVMKDCEYCETYLEKSINSECFLEEAQNGVIFSMLDITTEEGFKAYLQFMAPEPDENGKVQVMVPTTVIFATIKEVPGFNRPIAKAQGIVAPEKLCDALGAMKEMHKEALKKVREKLSEQNEVNK